MKKCMRFIFMPFILLLHLVITLFHYKLRKALGFQCSVFIFNCSFYSFWISYSILSCFQVIIPSYEFQSLTSVSSWLSSTSIWCRTLTDWWMVVNVSKEYVASIFCLPWRCRSPVPTKHWYMCKNLCSIICQ